MRHCWAAASLASRLARRRFLDGLYVMRHLLMLRQPASSSFRDDISFGKRASKAIEDGRATFHRKFGFTDTADDTHYLKMRQSMHEYIHLMAG